MKEFRCLIGVRQPSREVAAAIRDRLVFLAPELEHVQEVETVIREERADGGAQIVNSWRVNPPLPAALHGVVSADMLGWLDHAEWSADLSACAWRIEPFFMPEAIRCRGITRFESAMGGRGTRATFEGSLDIDPVALSRLQPAWRGPVSAAVEILIGTIIPKNFRRTVEAVTASLETAVSPAGRHGGSPAADRRAATGPARTPEYRGAEPEGGWRSTDSRTL